LNCGTTGTVICGGGIGATLEALPIPLGSVGILLNALAAAAFIRPAPDCPIAPAPGPRANAAAGAASSGNNANATFTGVFDMGKLHFIHGNAVCVKPM
jgi:hypothetical protein